METNQTTEITQGNGFDLPGTVQTINLAGKVLAFHVREYKGRTSLALSEVVPSRMNGREVAAWKTVFGGVRLSWEKQGAAAADFEAALKVLRPTGA